MVNENRRLFLSHRCRISCIYCNRLLVESFGGKRRGLDNQAASLVMWNLCRRKATILVAEHEPE
jgi:hypothetical protein